MEHTKIALFVDTENLTHWIKNNGIEYLISELGATGQIIVRRAYGNWGNSSIQSFQATLNQFGFELIHNFHPVSKKNSSDIQLTIDVIEYALRLHDAQWFVLATGDSDFSPLFRRLREMGKDVIGVGPRSPLSESVKTSCSRFIYTDTQANPASNNLDSSDVAKEIHSATDDAMDIVERILKANDSPVPLSTLKNKILNIDSAFNEKQLGYSSFLDFLQSNSTFSVTQNGKNNSWTAHIIPVNEKLTTTLPLDEPLEKQYEKLLRLKQWRPVSSTALKAIYSTMEKSEPATKEATISTILFTPGNTIPQTDLNKAFAILIKSGVFKHAPASDPTGDKPWRVDKTIGHYIAVVDQALISRLIHSAQEKNIPIEKDALRNFLYGEYDNSTLDNLILKSKKTYIADIQSLEEH